MIDEVRYRLAETRLWDSLAVAPSEHRVRLAHAGTTIRVQEVGAGPPVLFLHGASTSGTSWADLVARLPGFRCLIVDRPGTGLSEPLRAAFRDAAAFAAYADTFVADALDGLGVASAHLAASSYGGYLALRGAWAHPDRVGRIMEFGWTVGAPLARPPAILRLASVPAIGRLMAALPANRTSVRAMFRRIGLRQALEAGRISEEAIDAYVALLRYTDTMRNEMAASRWTMSARKGLVAGVTLSDAMLAAIASPVSFLWGAEDPFGGASVARDFVRRIPNAQLELVPGAGHAVWMDDADHAAAVTRGFLAA